MHRQYLALRHHFETNKAFFEVVQFYHGVDSIVYCVAKQRVDVLYLHEGQSLAVRHNGQANIVLLANEGFFRQDYVQRFVVRLDNRVVDVDCVFYFSYGFATDLVVLSDKSYLMFQVVAL